MKTFAKLFAVLAFLAVGFTSCGGDEVEDLVISKESVTLNANQSETIAIESGNGSYKAVSTNDAVATATIKDDVITVTAHADGNAVITISDKEDKSVLINVTVGTPAPTYEKFTVTLGGSEATTAGSFLSVKDKKAYKSTEITSTSNNVEIIFTGTEFKSAKDSKNANVNGNGHSATLTVVSATVYGFVTSTGFTGTLTITSGDANSASAVIEVEVATIVE